MSVTGDQRYFVVLEIKDRWKIFKQILSVAYLHVIYKAWKRYSYWGIFITLSNTPFWSSQRHIASGQTEIDQFSIKFAVDYFAMETLNENIKSPLKISPYIRVHINIIPWKVCALNSKKLLTYLPVNFAVFLRRLLFNILYCFCILVNKHVAKFTDK